MSNLEFLFNIGRLFNQNNYTLLLDNFLGLVFFFCLFLFNLMINCLLYANNFTKIKKNVYSKNEKKTNQGNMINSFYLNCDYNNIISINNIQQLFDCEL